VLNAIEQKINKYEMLVKIESEKTVVVRLHYELLIAPDNFLNFLHKLMSSFRVFFCLFHFFHFYYSVRTALFTNMTTTQTEKEMKKKKKLPNFSLSNFLFCFHFYFVFFPTRKKKLNEIHGRKSGVAVTVEK
jgi:hypothetical protein